MCVGVWVCVCVGVWVWVCVGVGVGVHVYKIRSVVCSVSCTCAGSCLGCSMINVVPTCYGIHVLMEQLELMEQLLYVRIFGMDS